MSPRITCFEEDNQGVGFEVNIYSPLPFSGTIRPLPQICPLACIRQALSLLSHQLKAFDLKAITSTLLHQANYVVAILCGAR
jgi:hypothetical protein